MDWRRSQPSKTRGGLQAPSSSCDTGRTSTYDAAALPLNQDADIRRFGPGPSIVRKPFLHATESFAGDFSGPGVATRPRADGLRFERRQTRRARCNARTVSLDATRSIVCPLANIRNRGVRQTLAITLHNLWNLTDNFVAWRTRRCHSHAPALPGNPAVAISPPVRLGGLGTSLRHA